MITLLLFASHLFSLLATAPASCVSSISGYLTAPYTVWFPVVTLATLAIISILAVIYALSPFISTGGNIRAWTRVKIYELLVSLILVIIFASFATVLCTTDPTQTLSNAGLISSACTTSGGAGGSANLYSIAVCNLYQFNNHVAQLTLFVYYVQAIVAFQPSFSGSFTVSAPAALGSVEASISGLEIAPVGLLTGSLSSASLNNFGDYLVPLFFTFVMLNQLQLILVSAAPLLFALFMAVGLIARAFGITRTFGGAMIAFALGLGFLYPLLVAVNYGFINYVLEHTPAPFLSTTGVSGVSAFTGAIANPILVFVSILGTFVSGGNLNSAIPEYLFVWIGLVIVGIVFVDILNFVILDTFITDFSQALGERMSFFAIMQNII